MGIVVVLIVAIIGLIIYNLTIHKKNTDISQY